MTALKKYIELALPLEAINSANASEKSRHNSHPSILFLLWIRWLLAVSRAVIFPKMGDYPYFFPCLLQSEKSKGGELV